MSEIGKTLVETLASELGRDRVFEDEATRAEHRVDYWILAHLRRREGRLDADPSCVVRPRSTEEVAKAMRVAQRGGVPVVPYGGGSGVLGGAVPPAGAVVIDLRAMNRLLEVNDTALLARVEAGMMGSDYEAALVAKGYTSGHYPQSIERATVGGLCATRSAGQFSTKYGNIEDMCLGLEVVLASGEVIRLDPFPRSATGPSLREVFLGSEGALGIVTEATLKIHPTPEHRLTETFAFPSVGAGLEAIRRVMRGGWRPAVVRLYDASEAAGHFSKWVPAEQCALLVLCEGPRALAEAEMAACREAAREGTAIGSGAIGHWLGHRNTVPSWDTLMDKGLIADTIEIAASWDKVGRLYERVVSALGGVPGMVAASAHSSHSYLTGTNLYVTFAIQPADFAQAEALYLESWSRVMQTTIDSGGTIAHHHGVGRLRVPWLEKELGAAHQVLRALKRALDPAGILNPGTLLAG
jgi:alkyldihydroxyacetonephosphate synthase